MTRPGVGAGRTQAVAWLPWSPAGCRVLRGQLCRLSPGGSRPSRLVQALMPDRRLQLGQLAGLYCFTPLVGQQTTMALRGQKVCERKVGLGTPSSWPSLPPDSQDEATGWSQQHVHVRFPDHLLLPVLSRTSPRRHRRREGENLVSAAPCPSCGGGDVGVAAKREGLKHLRPAGEQDTAAPVKQGQEGRRHGRPPWGPTEASLPVCPCEPGWDLGPFAAAPSPGHTSPSATKYRD